MVLGSKLTVEVIGVPSSLKLPDDGGKVPNAQNIKRGVHGAAGGSQRTEGRSEWTAIGDGVRVD